MMAQFTAYAQVPWNVFFYMSTQWTNRICNCFTARRYRSVVIYLEGSGGLRESKTFQILTRNKLYK